jgi:putative MATE family efflux protein
MNNKAELTYSGLFFFSIPSILGSLLEPISGVVDSALVGHINTVWLAALSIGVILLSSFTWVFNFLIHTSTQAVSEAFSKGNSVVLIRKVKVAIYLSFIIGIVSSVFLYIFRLPLFELAGASSELVGHVEKYFNVRLLGQTFLIVSFTCISILRGLSKVKLSFYLILITTALNILVSWYLLFFTSLGIAAVAWGTVIAAFISMILSFYLLFKEAVIRENFLKVDLDKTQWIHFGKNSFDMFCRSLVITTCFFLSTRFASRFGSTTLAAHQILLELWLISSFLTDGVAVTANILAAKFKGTNSLAEYRLMKKRILIIGGAIGLCFTLSYFFVPRILWGVFSNDPEVFKTIEKVWIYISISQVFLALSYVYDGLLFGLEKFSYLRKQMFFAFIFSYLPFAIYSVMSESFLSIWLGLISLGIYRLFMGYFGTLKPWESSFER